MAANDPGEEIRRLERCISDLISILALPAVWSRRESRQMVSTFQEALIAMLDLDFIYTRASLYANGMQIAELLTSPPYTAANLQNEIRRNLEQRFGDNPPASPPKLCVPSEGQEILTLSIRLGLEGEIGVVVAGSRRADFPTQTERLLLGVAANQLAVGLQQVLLLSEQINTMPVLAWSALGNGDVDFFNQRWLEYTGLTTEQAKGWGWADAFHPQDLSRLQDYWLSLIATGTPGEIEARLKRFDGSYRWFLLRINPLRDDAGTVVKWYGTNTDIDDRKRAEEELRLRELNLLQITETIPEMLWSATPDGAIDYCNGRLLAYTGLSTGDLLGSGWAKVLHPDDVAPTTREWMSCIDKVLPYRVEVRTYHAADHTYRWCVMNALPLMDEQGRIVKWHGTVVDLHDWKQAQDELRNSQAELARMMRVTSIGQLTASIAHEVNQPLSGVVTNASTCLRMLSSDPPNMEGARETARRTIRDGNRASEVVTRLRALFKRKKVAAEWLDLNDAAREVIALSLSELQSNGIVVRHEFAENLPEVKGDKLQLQQVILNLVRNASDAMRDLDEEPRQLLVKTECDDGRNVQLTVRDTGIGFAPETLDRLFESFYTTKEDGMGIGLSVSRSIVEAHQGRLWGTKNDGPGASFVLSIPFDCDRSTDT
jgi:PAS domain S-box-containing protein